MAGWANDPISWAEMIAEFHDVIIACTLNDEQMCKKFDPSMGRINGVPFTAWSEEWVYFPCTYDRSEWIGRAPRNVCEHVCRHMGGG